ncbi:hypothetical protein FN846DRAFT_910740 [Sphaerosporella brunnea]|uniref:Uncharacterized protein n=1 Tax=Sphaerosporella brunnea TaxID=1250544 RepID=A0A5J5EMB8_9PEZI|nr:hypothetical protein FN846DRAFT_910740 [Sphaerosporella brunnea]
MQNDAVERRWVETADIGLPALHSLHPLLKKKVDEKLGAQAKRAKAAVTIRTKGALLEEEAGRIRNNAAHEAAKLDINTARLPNYAANFRSAREKFCSSRPLLVALVPPLQPSLTPPPLPPTSSAPPLLRLLSPGLDPPIRRFRICFALRSADGVSWRLARTNIYNNKLCNATEHTLLPGPTPGISEMEHPP